MHHELIYVWPGLRLRVEFGHGEGVQIEGVLRKSQSGEDKYGLIIEGAMYWSTGTFDEVLNGQTQVSRLLVDYLVATGVLKKENRRA